MYVSDTNTSDLEAFHGHHHRFVDTDSETDQFQQGPSHLPLPCEEDSQNEYQRGVALAELVLGEHVSYCFMRLHLAGLITEVLPPPPVLSTKVLKEAWVGKKDQLETLDQRPITQFLYTFTPEVKIRSNPVWKRLADLLFTLFERKVASRTLTAVTSDLISSSNSFVVARWGNDTATHIRLFDRRNQKFPLVQVIADFFDIARHPVVSPLSVL